LQDFPLTLLKAGERSGLLTRIAMESVFVRADEKLTTFMELEEY
jgi:hypothetical protein